MCYAQTYNKMVFALENSRPYVLNWIENEDGGISFSFVEFTLKYQKSVYVDGTKREDLYQHVSNYTYEDFLDDGNYPSGVAFVANRLAFYNFKNQPYGLYMSKPFEYDDFQESVVYLNEVPLQYRDWIHLFGKILFCNRLDIEHVEPDVVYVNPLHSDS